MIDDTDGATSAELLMIPQVLFDADNYSNGRKQKNEHKCFHSVPHKGEGGLNQSRHHHMAFQQQLGISCTTSPVRPMAGLIFLLSLTYAGEHRMNTGSRVGVRSTPYHELIQPTNLNCHTSVKPLNLRVQAQ